MIHIVCPVSGHKNIAVKDACITVPEIQVKVLETWGFEENDFYMLHNGRKLLDEVLTDGIIHVIPRLVGGKGGFGSMLRAIGAQIEKTTNREACRDLSGRRLRDINEEKRLKNWIAQQAEREREAAERKRKKLERLRAEPKHNFHDDKYEEQRSVLTENVSDAVEQGFKVASSGSSCNTQKRKASSTVTTETKKKKKSLWLDPDEDLSSSVESDDSDAGDDVPSCSEKVKQTDGVLKDMATPSTSSEDATCSSQSSSENGGHKDPIK